MLQKVPVPILAKQIELYGCHKKLSFCLLVSILSPELLLPLIRGTAMDALEGFQPA